MSEFLRFNSYIHKRSLLDDDTEGSGSGIEGSGGSGDNSQSTEAVTLSPTSVSSKSSVIPTSKVSSAGVNKSGGEQDDTLELELFGNEYFTIALAFAIVLFVLVAISLTLTYIWKKIMLRKKGFYNMKQFIE